MEKTMKVKKWKIRVLFFAVGIMLISCQSQEKLNQLLITAVIQGDLAQAEGLIAKGADVNTRSNDGLGFTLLHYAAVNDQPEMIRLLAKHKADFSVADQNGYTVAHACVNHHMVKCLKTLIELDAPLDRPGQICGETPLYYAVIDNKADMVNLLIDHGCDPETATSEGSTLLHKAAFYGHAELCRLLVEKRLDPNRKDKDGKTPREIAVEMKHNLCVNVLSKYR
jgi:palmitoyltransferase